MSLPIDLQHKIEAIRKEFEVAQSAVLENISTSEVINRAEAFEEKISKKLSSLKKQFAEYPELIQLCEELATFFLDCGDMHFHKDKNATTTVDRMYYCASATLKGINASPEMVRKLEGTYQDWHWHGW